MLQIFEEINQLSDELDALLPCQWEADERDQLPGERSYTTFWCILHDSAHLEAE